MKRVRVIYILTLLVVAIMLMTGCSTTKRLAEGDVLYTGVKEMTIEGADGRKIASTVNSQVEDALSVPPNNALFSSNSIKFLPIELWAWNYLYTPNEKSVKGWLYNLFAAEPVLIQTVRPDIRVSMAKDILFNNGYFNSTSSYTVNYDEKNSKKASVSYRVVAGAPYTLDSISFPSDTTHVASVIRSIADKSLLYKGQRYCADTLSLERERITYQLRDSGFYYFRSEYLLYQADTTRNSGRVDLRMMISPTAPYDALRSYKTGRITVRMHPPEGEGVPDTLSFRSIDVYAYEGLKLRRSLLPSSIDMRTGRTFSLTAQNQSLRNLSSLGIFRSVVMDVTPIDSIQGRDSIDVDIDLRYALPMSMMVEANVASKSNSYLGPGLILGLSHNNLFGGGEQLSVSLNGSYEWQTGKDKDASLFNSYEFGLNSSLIFPRMLGIRPPRYLRRLKSSTRIQLGANIMNRPHYFRMVSFNTAFAYEFHTSSTAMHNFTPFELGYTKMLRTTEEFDKTLAENPAIALSFRDQFIPKLSYMFTYDNGYEKEKKNRWIWQIGFSEAGNIFYGAYSLFGVKGEKKIFGNPFSQFVKLTNELKYYHYFTGKLCIASRLYIGAGYAYGNATELPYSEQFYIGGANSLRAFTIRSIGPGSYRPDMSNENGFFDQTGNFKLEANIELRVPIWGGLEGALFVDAGNIWLLKKDELRPGGELTLQSFARDIALGTGLGVRYDIANYLVVRVDVGVPIHAPYYTQKSGYYNIEGSFWKNLRLHLAIGYPF